MSKKIFKEFAAKSENKQNKLLNKDRPLVREMSCDKCNKNKLTHNMIVDLETKMRAYVNYYHCMDCGNGKGEIHFNNDEVLHIVKNAGRKENPVSYGKNKC